MPQQIGSQFRETMAEANYELVARIDEDEVILKDRTLGTEELWVRHDDYAGWTLEIDGVGYEFVTSCYM